MDNSIKDAIALLLGKFEGYPAGKHPTKGTEYFQYKSLFQLKSVITKF
ncbi:hypothetical protein NG791_22450 [Laspinema sp. D1]|nr:hypothetical protein [Laspinema sp. D2b]